MRTSARLDGSRPEFSVSYVFLVLVLALGSAPLCCGHLHLMRVGLLETVSAQQCWGLTYATFRAAHDGSARIMR